MSYTVDEVHELFVNNLFVAWKIRAAAAGIDVSSWGDAHQLSVDTDGPQAVPGARGACIDDHDIPYKRAWPLANKQTRRQVGVVAWDQYCRSVRSRMVGSRDKNNKRRSWHRDGGGSTGGPAEIHPVGAGDDVDYRA
jgi:hypothetical protein